MISRIGVLLGKDVRILRRSPFLLASLVLYPLAIALLVGLVARFANDRPRVAFVDLDGLPEVLSVGGEDFNVDKVLRQVRAEVDCERGAGDGGANAGAILLGHVTGDEEQIPGQDGGKVGCQRLRRRRQGQAELNQAGLD